MKACFRLAASTLLLITALHLGGCASLGPVYSKVDKLPEDSAVVYFYRPSSFIGGGVSYDIKNGDTVITTLYNGGYFPYYSTAGEKEFWAKTEAKTSITLDVQKGKTYYVKGEVGVGFLIGRPHLMVVAPDIAEKEIAECKLIPATK